jgi:hypothetical protein
MMNLIRFVSVIGCAMMVNTMKRITMEISESDRDAYLDLLYDMYDAELVDVALDTLGENELLDGIPRMLEDYYFDENEDW